MPLLGVKALMIRFSTIKLPPELSLLLLSSEEIGRCMISFPIFLNIVGRKPQYSNLLTLILFPADRIEQPLYLVYSSMLC